MKATNLISKGNKKLPKTTWIFNSGSATNCPSKKLGLCQCADKCYARKAEKQYPAVLPYRERQARLWTQIDGFDFVAELIASSNRSRTNKMKCFRFNESGDFENQEQLNWFIDVCRLLAKMGIACYGYTARTDLDLSELLKFAQVNVSNDGNDWQDRGANRFKAVEQYSGNELKCAGNCSKCNLCFTVKQQVIEVEIH